MATIKLNVKQILKKQGKTKYWLFNELNNMGTISYSNFNKYNSCVIASILGVNQEAMQWKPALLESGLLSCVWQKVYLNTR